MATVRGKSEDTNGKIVQVIGTVVDAEFPLASVTVKVTVFSIPILAHVKVTISKDVVKEQLSEEPLSIISGVIVALPFASKFIDMS